MQQLDSPIKLINYRVIANLSDMEKDNMKNDPVAMYLHSLRTETRLPDELHESMLLHSFDPLKSHNVRAYLEWIQSCEERDKNLAMYLRREKMLENMMACSMVFAMACYVSIVVWSCAG